MAFSPLQNSPDRLWGVGFQSLTSWTCQGNYFPVRFNSVPYDTPACVWNTFSENWSKMWEYVLHLNRTVTKRYLRSLVLYGRISETVEESQLGSFWCNWEILPISDTRIFVNDLTNFILTKNWLHSNPDKDEMPRNWLKRVAQARGAKF